MENLFVLQIVRDNNDTQLNLSLVDLEKKTVKNDYCEGCTTRELNLRVAKLVEALINPTSVPVPPVAKEDPHQTLIQQMIKAIESHKDQEPEAGKLVTTYLRQYGNDRLKTALSLTPQGQFHLGKIYRKGYGLSSNSKEAVYWYQQSATKGYAPAQSALGFLYRHGEGISQDEKQAVGWYQKAADQGYAPALFNLASMYRKGYGVSADPKRALELYQKAAQAGDSKAPKLVHWMKSQ